VSARRRDADEDRASVLGGGREGVEPTGTSTAGPPGPRARVCRSRGRPQIVDAATATCSRLSAWPARSSVIARRRVAATASSPRGADLRERLARRRVDGRGNRIASRVDDHQVQEVGECPHEASRQGPQLPAVRRLDDRCLRDRAQDVLGRGDDLVRNGGARHGEPEGLECDLAPLRVQLAIRSVDAEGHEGHQRDHRNAQPPSKPDSQAPRRTRLALGDSRTLRSWRSAPDDARFETGPRDPVRLGVRRRRWKTLTCPVDDAIKTSQGHI